MIPIFKKSMFYSLAHPFKNIKQFFRVLRWAWQRTQNGFSDYDVMDLDVYLLTVIRESITSYKNVVESTEYFFLPVSVIYEYYQKHQNEIGLTWEELQVWSEENEGKCEEVLKDVKTYYISILDKIVYLFQEADEDLCKDAETEDTKFYNEIRREEAFDMLNQYIDCLWY